MRRLEGEGGSQWVLAQTECPGSLREVELFEDLREKVCEISVSVSVGVWER